MLSGGSDRIKTDKSMGERPKKQKSAAPKKYIFHSPQFTLT
jgi:hypothetical protein